MQSNKILGLIFQIENLVKRYCAQEELEMSNSIINVCDVNSGQCEIIGKKLHCQFYLKDLQPKAEGSISRVED